MATRKCIRCGEEKPLEDLVRNPRQPFGREQLCRLCKNADLRKYNVRYTKTKFGFLMRTYRNMKSRVEGVQQHKAHLYVGKYLLPKETFYGWAEAQAEFHRLFAAWEQTKYSRRFTPTVDRIDATRGYELSNMEWVTHSENSRRGNASRIRQGLHRRLTLAAVRDIRNSAERRQSLADKHGVSISTVYGIRNGSRWKNAS